jgi:hypothetical protein
MQRYISLTTEQMKKLHNTPRHLFRFKFARFPLRDKIKSKIKKPELVKRATVL